MQGQPAFERFVELVVAGREGDLHGNQAAASRRGLDGEPVEILAGDLPAAVALNGEGEGGFRCVGECDLSVLDPRDDEQRRRIDGLLRDVHHERLFQPLARERDRTAALVAFVRGRGYYDLGLLLACALQRCDFGPVVEARCRSLPRDVAVNREGYGRGVGVAEPQRLVIRQPGTERNFRNDRERLLHDRHPAGGGSGINGQYAAALQVVVDRRGEEHGARIFRAAVHLRHFEPVEVAFGDGPGLVRDDAERHGLLGIVGEADLVLKIADLHRIGRLDLGVGGARTHRHARGPCCEQKQSGYACFQGNHGLWFWLVIPNGFRCGAAEDHIFTISEAASRKAPTP